MRKSVILEGPNGGGKSTLGNYLSIDLGIPYIHSGPNPGNTQKAIQACQEQLGYILSGSIVDRVTPISRPIYDHDIIPELELMIFNDKLNKMTDYAIVIYCCGEGKFEEKDYYPEGHYEKIIKDRQKIRDLYFEYMQGIDHIRFDWTNDSYKLLLEKVNEKLHSL